MGELRSRLKGLKALSNSIPGCNDRRNPRGEANCLLEVGLSGLFVKLWIIAGQDGDRCLKHVHGMG